MILETRRDECIILIPESNCESEALDKIFGSIVQTGEGLITKIQGEYRIADGYGPNYVSLRAIKSDPEKES